MSVQRVYVGEPGGENLDVAAETGGKRRFEPGDTVEISEELAERLDASWATQEEADEAGVEASDDEVDNQATEEGEASAEANAEAAGAADDEGGDE